MSADPMHLAAPAAHSLTSNGQRLCLAATLHGQQDAVRGARRQVGPARGTAALQPLAARVLP